MYFLYFCTLAIFHECIKVHSLWIFVQTHIFEIIMKKKRASVSFTSSEILYNHTFYIYNFGHFKYITYFALCISCCIWKFPNKYRYTKKISYLSDVVYRQSPLIGNSVLPATNFQNSRSHQRRKCSDRKDRNRRTTSATRKGEQRGHQGEGYARQVSDTAKRSKGRCEGRSPLIIIIPRRY